MDDVLFSFSSDWESISMHAFCLQSNIWLPCSFKEPHIILYPGYVKLVDLGKGRIILVWCSLEEIHKSTLVCVTVRVEVLRDDARVPISVSATQESVAYFPLERKVSPQNMVCVLGNTL